MLSLDHCFRSLVSVHNDFSHNNNNLHCVGGLFLEESSPASFVSLIFQKNSRPATVWCAPRRTQRRGLGFLSVTLSPISGDSSDEGNYGEVSVRGVLENIGKKSGESENEGEIEEVAFNQVVREDKSGVLKSVGGGTLNTAKHLWAGAVAAMVSRERKLCRSLGLPMEVASQTTNGTEVRG